MKYKDYYEALGVKRTATAEEIQKAYRSLARKYHPDVSKEAGAEDRFKEINEAHEVLKDPEKRKRYDSLGSSFHSGQDFRPPPGWSGFDFGGGSFQSGGVTDFSDFFEAIFGAGGGEYRGAGGSKGQRGKRRSGATERPSAELELGFEEALRGGERNLVVSTGERSDTGTPIRVEIPAGMKDGMSLRLTKEKHGAELLLKLRVRTDPRFSSQGDDVTMLVPVTPAEAALGAKVEVRLPSGKIKVAVPPSSQSVKKVRIPGKGLWKAKGVRGDLYLEFQVVLPKELSEKERQLYQELADISKFDPRA